MSVFSSPLQVSRGSTPETPHVLEVTGQAVGVGLEVADEGLLSLGRGGARRAGAHNQNGRPIRGR